MATLPPGRRSEVDRLSQAILREFMHRNKCTESLESFDREKPRDEDTISSRKIISEMMSLERLIKANKARSDPFPSMLEIVINFFLDKQHENGNGEGNSTTDGSRSKSSKTKEKPKDAKVAKDPRDIAKRRHKHAPSAPSALSAHQQHQGGDVAGIDRDSPSPPPHPRRVGGLFGDASAPTSSHLYDANDGDSGVNAVANAHTDDPFAGVGRGETVGHIGLVGRKVGGIGSAATASPPRTTTTTTTHRPIPSRTHSLGNDTGMVIEDVDDFDMDEEAMPLSDWRPGPMGKPAFGTTTTTTTGSSSSVVGGVGRGKGQGQGSRIDSGTMRDVRKLLFGDSKGSFPPSYQQGFYFTSEPLLPYGLWQDKGGPCGVLATVQGYVLQYIFDEFKGRMTARDLGTLTSRLRDDALAYALGHIIWQAGEPKGQATVVVGGGGRECVETRSEQATVSTIRQHWSVYTAPRGDGIQLFIHSVILSHGIDNIREEMDDENAKLIGRHDYCTQEMVNLCNIGIAVSNVHDDRMSSGSVGGVELRGVPRQGALGYLTLYEAHGYVKVGNNLKSPKYPIWILNSESHFSILFSLSRECMQEQGQVFDIYYYDELGRQDEVLRLTCDARGTKPITYDPDSNDLTPPIDACIRTRWPTATVDWNGSEPFL